MLLWLKTFESGEDIKRSKGILTRAAAWPQTVIYPDTPQRCGVSTFVLLVPIKSEPPQFQKCLIFTTTHQREWRGKWLQPNAVYLVSSNPCLSSRLSQDVTYTLLLLDLKHNPRQDGQLTTLIAVRICLSTEVMCDHVRVCEVLCVWNCLCGITTVWSRVPDESSSVASGAWYWHLSLRLCSSTF